MELPLGGPALRHYTQSRPRPHRQKLNYRPSRPQETIIESENETLEFMGRVDEGVEEFFTKRVLPTDTLKPQDEETITVHEVAPASSVPCPPPSKTLRRKLGDFFTLKKRRGLKSETSHEGRPKKASIADLIRPLREVARSEKEKDKDRVKELDKENEKEKAKEQPSAVTGESGIRETPASGAPPLRGDAAPPRRALREGKSQSLILLSGSAAAGSTNARNTAKKQLEGQHSFEQKLHLMLQRIGVSKPQPEETQNPEGEMKKAESEGTIIDSKPEPPPTFSKPRTMSASSDTRHQIRASVSAHEAAGKPALLPKPVIKPGPPPTTSGRNTPENELAQIEEAEKNTPTKQSPASSLTASALTAITSSVPTISNSIPDSTDLPGPASSTVTPSDEDICTASVVATTADISATKDTAVDSIASIPETSACTTDLPTTTVTTALTSVTTPTEPLPAVSVTSTTSESITLVVSVSSTSPTTTGPSITASETASAPSSESSVTTASTNLPIKSDLPEPKGIFPADATAAGDATIPVTTAASSLCTSTSDTPSSSSIPINLMSEASDDATSVTSVLLITETTSSPLNSSVITTTAAPTDTPFTTSSTTISATLTSTTSTASCIAETISPTSSDSMNSVSTSNIIPLSSSGPSDSSVPSTSSSDTNPTDTTSTASSLNRADTTSTSSSATTMAVSSAVTTDSDPPLSNNVSTTLTPTSTSLTAAVNSSATSHRVTSPAPSNDSPCQDDSLSPEERSGKGSAEKDAADGELDMIHRAKLMETDEKQETLDSEKKSDASEEKQTEVDSEATRREAQDESVEVEDTLSKPASGKKDVQSKDEGMTKGGKEEETQPVSDK